MEEKWHDIVALCDAAADANEGVISADSQVILVDSFIHAHYGPANCMVAFISAMEEKRKNSGKSLNTVLEFLTKILFHIINEIINVVLWINYLK